MLISEDQHADYFYTLGTFSGFQIRPEEIFWPHISRKSFKNKSLINRVSMNSKNYTTRNFCSSSHTKLNKNYGKCYGNEKRLSSHLVQLQLYCIVFGHRNHTISTAHSCTWPSINIWFLVYKAVGISSQLMYLVYNSQNISWEMGTSLFVFFWSSTEVWC